MVISRVLVVEDNPITRKMVRVALAAEGYQVEEAPSGGAALEAVTRETPDLVLQDLLLPDMDGWELARKLRTLPGGLELPIIAFTGLLSRIEEMKFAAASFTDLLIKPVEPTRLVKTVRAYVTPHANSQPNGQTLLLVDDDPTQLKLAKARFTQQGYQVTAVTSGADALGTARREPPAIIVCDLLMPHMDGFQLCAAVRSDPRLRTIPLVLVSSHYPDQVDRDFARRVGASDLLCRSIGVESLMAAVDAVLKNRWAPPAVLADVEPDSEHIQRAVLQLERQSAINSGMAERCALQSAALSILSAISAAFSKDVALDQALELALQHCLDASALSHVALYLLDEHGQLEPKLQIGLVGNDWRSFFGHAGLFEDTLRQQQLKSLPSSTLSEQAAIEFLERAGGVTSASLVPVCSARGCLGVLLLTSKHRELYSDDWRAFVQTVAAQLGQGLAVARTLAELRDSDARYRMLLENANDAVVVVQSDGRITETNAVGERLYGRTRAEIVGRPFAEFFVHVPEDCPFAKLAEQRKVRADGLEIQRADGSRVTTEASAAVVEFGGQRLTLSILRDVTEQQRIIAALRESEERFRTLVSSLDDFVFTLDTQQHHSGVFGRWLEREGLPPSHFLGRTPREVYGAASCAVHEEAGQRALTGSPVVYEWSLEGAAQTRFFQTSLSPVRDGAGEVVGLVGLAREITDLKKVQAQLLVSDRMFSMGMLAAGVAHEINNPLAAVMANLDLAARDAAEAVRTYGAADFGELVDELGDAREAADRVREIVRDLRVFSRSDDLKQGPVDLRRVLDSAARLAWNEIRHRARLVKEYRKVPPVEANEARLGQVFLNLIVNAAQAIPEGNAEGHEIRLIIDLDGAGNVVVEVRDTGVGIAPTVLPKLFTPFFTTKPLGVGTGLGLSICHRIISSLGGKIEVESEFGRGALFRVVLPEARPDAEIKGAFSSAPLPASRRGKILVVDDELTLGIVVRRTLAAEHDVTLCSSANDALRQILAGQRFDVILCDLMMPQMTGMDLHAELSRAVPEQAQRMVFLTGGAFTPRARAFLDETTNQRLDKPFHPQGLRALVNERVR